jgi:hypothetical protein
MGFSANIQAADAPIVRDVFSCNFNSGQDMGDLMSARDFFVRQMEKLGQDPGEHFVWTPFKAGDFPADFLWFANSPDLVTWGRDGDIYRRSAEGQAAEARFNQVATCTSTMAMRRQFYQGAGEMTGGPPAIINSSACNYQHGHGPEDLDDLLNHITREIDALGRNDGFMGFVASPLVGSGNAPDLFLMGVQGSQEDWASRSVGLQSAPGGASLARHFNTILDCSSRLFLGERVVPVPE